MQDNAFSRLRSDVLATFPQLTEELSGELGPRQRELLDQSKARLEQGTCHVVVAGEYKRGKSTLLNALVERPGLFPVDVDVATCVVSTLAWGPDERAVVHLSSPDTGRGATQQLEVGLDRLPEFVTEQGNPRNHKRVQLVEIHAPVPELETGLVLIDTPGVGSVNPEHTAATHSFLDRADGLVFVCDAIEPLATYELDFLGRALEKCEVVITTVTKTDKVRDAYPVVAGAREKISGRTGRPADSLVIVPVSAFRKLKWLRDRTEDQLLADSGFPELDHALWEGLATTSGAVQLRRALDGLCDAVATAGSPLVNELAALETDESLERIRREVAETTARLGELSASGAEWRNELRRRFDLGTRPTRSALQGAFDTALRQYQEKVTAGADPGADELVGEVASDMLKALTTAHDQLAATAVEIMREFAERTSLQLTSPEVSKPPFTPAIAVPTVPLNVRPARFFDQFRASWSTGMAGMGAGGVVALVEPFSGIALLLGLGTMGFVHGVRNHRQDLRERAGRERAARLIQLVSQEFAASRRHATESFNQTYADFTQSLIAELNAQLSAQQESLTESGRRLQAVTGQTKADLARRRGELQARQQRYRRLQGELDRLRARVERLATLTPRPAPRPEPPVRPGVAPAKDIAADLAIGAVTEVALGAALTHPTLDMAKDTATADAPAADITPQDSATTGLTTAAAHDTDAEGGTALELDASFDPDQFDAP
ncbi:dynamin family protein [Streptomyces sp. NBC_01381]|uniref:dynamin family protein n=1 Tax=Streptomyces sp. NBC_01381 TaxID=2903845 RepID=UPI00224E7941|nr:dynamin family protein [Streptomyces sp. NBC_01381]MCX4671959.1 dynamin family protein [Streptomyces sp. NBC_01381]